MDNSDKQTLHIGNKILSAAIIIGLSIIFATILNASLAWAILN